MNVVFFILLSSAIAGVTVYLLLTAVLSYVRSRGTRLVTCPETGKPAAVALHSLKGALTAPFGKTEETLSECSRWPERLGCGQECLAEIAKAPDGCLVRERAARWYQGKSCAVCGNPFGEISFAEHRPALLSPGGVTVQWHQVPAERLPELFATHAPVCWNCHVVQRVVRDHPDLVVVRPPHPDPQQIPG